jgi:class 3 adenylate cyclase
MAQLPTGTVTFLFTDIASSTRLQQRLGSSYAQALGDHQALLRAAFAEHGGAEVDTQGDAFFVAFASAPEAVAAAAQAQVALAAHRWPDGSNLRVRMGLHSGTPQLVGNHYVGLDVVVAARIAASGHGGQVLLSQTTRDLAAHTLPEGMTLRDLGAHRLKDLQHAEHLYQLVLSGLPTDFPPLRTLDAHPNNLPLQPTPLLGREEQVDAVGKDTPRNERPSIRQQAGAGDWHHHPRTTSKPNSAQLVHCAARMVHCGRNGKRAVKREGAAMADEGNQTTGDGISQDRKAALQARLPAAFGSLVPCCPIELCCPWERLPAVDADFGREQLMGGHESPMSDRRVQDAGVAVQAPVNHRLTASLADGIPCLELDMPALADGLADGAFRHHGRVSL